ncbi:kinetochore protein NDC80 homolog [Nerophis lumbriciformis]|uniref:kinetochore protein NDC80 homolog n=1 Tax=Nerophis lumbriciformis TaxID=546530 RepID=UPI002AE04972|nr:kinetochore protein NDC80 homolog [Nerophis lumbriciformis]
MERGRLSRVTGSRPSDFPMRVQDNNRKSTAYTTPRSKQPSFGMLNIPKPQSGTSERRTSFFGPRMSGAGMPRTSSMSGFGGTEKVKDARPLHDKSYVQQCIRQLHEFLTEQGYPGLLSPKTLQSPSTKEFVKIFEFIYCQLDPTFEMPNSKVEEEVPALLKALRYPFVLSKCSMYSVGAPHTWPQALGALMWMIDTVKINWSLSKQDLLFSDFCEDSDNVEECAEYNKLFLDYTADTYSKFLQGADTFEDDDETFLTKLKKLYNVDEDLLTSTEEKNRILTEEVERLEKESQKDRLTTKRMEKMKLQLDLKKLQEYRSNLESFQNNLQAKASELTDELDNAASSLESLKHQQVDLQNILQNQKFTPADVERINREKRELQHTIGILSKSLENAQQHMWNEEIALAKVKEKADLKLAEYHSLARKVKLIPMSAENAGGRDFELRPFDSGPGNIQFMTQTQNLLKKLVRDVEEENGRLPNMKLSLEEACEQVNLDILDKNNDLKQLKEQIRKVDERWDSGQEDLVREEQDWAAEMEVAENHRELLEKKVNYGYDEAVQQLKATQQQYHIVLQETNEEKRSVANNLTAVFTIAAKELSVTESSLENLHVRVQRLCSKAVEDDEAAVHNLKEMRMSKKEIRR